MRRTLEERFNEKLTWADNGCIEWRGSRTDRGYGQFAIEGKPKRAHRVAWLIAYGEWPEGNLLHSCDNPPCVNVEHLREGTQAENLAEMSARGRHRNQWFSDS